MMPRHEQGQGDAPSQNPNEGDHQEHVYAADSAAGRLSYQWLLRAVGSYLDEAGAHSITVLEEPDGFVVRFQQGRLPDSMVLTHFNTEELVALKEALLKNRRSGRYSGSSALNEPVDRYQDLFRALGFELDALKAYSLSIDEIGNDLFVSYLFLDPRHGYLWTKESIMLPMNGKQTLLQRARARRDPKGHRRGLFRSQH